MARLILEDWNSVNLTQVIAHQLEVEVDTEQETNKLPSFHGTNNPAKNKSCLSLRGMEVDNVLVKGNENKCDNNGPLDEEEHGRFMMIPLMIQSNVPDFQTLGDNNGPVLVGGNLTWMQFMQMFSERDPGSYVIKGEHRRVLKLKDLIGNYVRSVKNNGEPGRTYVIKIHRRRQTCSSKKRAEPLKIRLMKSKSLEMKVDDSGRTPRGEKKVGWRAKKAVSIPLMLTNKVTKSCSMENGKLSATDVMKIRPQRTSCRQTSNVSRRIGSQSGSASNSQDDDNTFMCWNKPNSIPQEPSFSVDNTANIKPHVINFLKSKLVSNRNMLRVRGELMELKANEDYFKLTAVAPLTAGLLEQMLCRPLPAQDHL